MTTSTKKLSAVFLAVVGVLMSAVAIAQPGPGDPPPPPPTWTISEPDTETAFSKDADIGCVGTAEDNTAYVCAISCVYQGGWTVKNSTNGTAVNLAWSCTVNHPPSYWTVGTDAARCELCPAGGPNVIGEPFDITN